MKLFYRTKTIAQATAVIWNRPLEPFEWFDVKAEDNGDPAEILIYDYIGWPFNDPGDLVRRLKDLGGRDVNVRIHSPGGDVFDAFAIYNAFSSYPGNVTMIADSMAASSASIILVSGKKVLAYSNSMLMIHEPWACICGNQFEFVEFADLLSKISSNMVDIYSQNSNLGKKEVRALMKGDGKQDGTYLTAKEALEKGFISEIIDSKSTAKAEYFTPFYASKNIDLTIRDAEKALRDAGFSASRAKAVLAGGWHGDSLETVGAISDIINNAIRKLR